MSSPEIGALSKAAFGNRARLEVYAALANVDGSTYAAEIADEVGHAANVVGGILDALAEVGLLADLPAVPGQRQRYYGVPSFRLWQAAAELAQLEVTEPADR